MLIQIKTLSNPYIASLWSELRPTKDIKLNLSYTNITQWYQFVRFTVVSTIPMSTQASKWMCKCDYVA